MRAAVYRGRHQLAVEETAEPAGPGRGEVLVEVAAASLCGTDAAEWLHGPILTRPPVVLGHEFVGRVVALGPDVDEGWEGRRVVSGSGVSCGSCAWCRAGRTNLCASYETLGLQRDGGLAERVLVPVTVCVDVPEGVGDVAAAMAQPLAVAIHATRRGGVGPGRSCVVIGAGGIGAFLVAAAVAAGAAPVIAIDLDAARLDTASALGAAAALDGASKDVEDRVLELTGGIGADSVLEATGALGAPAIALRITRRGGDVVLVGLHHEHPPLELLSVTTREIDVHGTLAHVLADDLPQALAVLEQSDLAEVVLGSVIGLGELLEEGIVPLAERRARGKVVVDVRRPTRLATATATGGAR